MKSNNLYKQIGSKIREARENAGVSQKSLAESVGFETSTAISLIASGMRRVAIDDLHKIAEVLHISIEYILGNKEEGPDIKFALRADKNLDYSDKKQIIDFIDFVKRSKNGR